MENGRLTRTGFKWLRLSKHFQYDLKFDIMKDNALPLQTAHIPLTISTFT